MHMVKTYMFENIINQTYTYIWLKPICSKTVMKRLFKKLIADCFVSNLTIKPIHG